MIDLTTMDEVLLADGAWHKVDRGSFRIAEYKIGVASENKVQFDGRTEKDCVASLMACWKEEGRCTFAPVAAVMGYKTAESNGHRR
jgi:hypothetical protein